MTVHLKTKMNTIFLCALLVAGVASIANVVDATAVPPKITASVYQESMPMLYGKWPSGFDEFANKAMHGSVLRMVKSNQSINLFSPVRLLEWRH